MSKKLEEFIELKVSELKECAGLVCRIEKNYFKVGLSPSKKIFFICFNDSPWKMMKNAFYFILKALFVLKVFKFLSWHFGRVVKTAWRER